MNSIATALRWAQKSKLSGLPSSITSGPSDRPQGLRHRVQVL